MNTSGYLLSTLAIDSSSSLVYTEPVGFEGEHIMMALVLGVMAAST